MNLQVLDETDHRLIAAASAVLEKNYRAERHTIGSAVLCESGKIFAAVNVDSCGYGPCAEPIAVGSAISGGERGIQRIVAVDNARAPHNVVSPCGNCRQLLLDYAPECWVIVKHETGLARVRARDLLPIPYQMF